MVTAFFIGLLLNGCNSTNDSYKKGKVVLKSGELVGETKGTEIYESGAKLFKNGELVGFVDLDGLVYEKSNYLLDSRCGGELYAFCRNEVDFTDGILTGTCVIDKNADEVKASNGIGSNPARSFDCGKKQ